MGDQKERSSPVSSSVAVHFLIIGESFLLALRVSLGVMAVPCRRGGHGADYKSTGVIPPGSRLAAHGR